MAKQKFKLTLTNVGLIALIIIISAFIFTSSPPAFTGAATTTVDLVMPFAIDAWGSIGWTDCSTQMNGKAWADQYCQAKGYASAQSCYLENKMERWKWAGTAAAPQKGTSTGGGTAFTKVKCVSAATSSTTTTPVTKTVTKTADALVSDKIILDFGKEYKNVVQVYVEGRPGGEFCKARISVQPYTSSGFISTYTLYTGAVDTHKTATKTFPFSEPGIAIRKVVGKPISAGDANAVNCGLIDYMKVTLTYNE